MTHQKLLALIGIILVLSLSIDYWSFSRSSYSAILLQSLPKEEVDFMNQTAIALTSKENCTETPLVCILKWTNKSIVFNEKESSHDPFLIMTQSGGMCDEYSIVFLSLVATQGYRGRLIGLEGKKPHFVTEIQEDGKWHVYDPTLGVYFNKSVQELFENPPSGFEDQYSVQYRTYEWYGKTTNAYSSYDTTIVSWIKVWYWRLRDALGLKARESEGAC